MVVVRKVVLANNKLKLEKGFCHFKLYSNFNIHQRKGGIHDIYRSFMEAFGYFRVTGLCPLKYLLALLNAGATKHV